MSILLVVYRIAAFLLLVVFAALQWNDPDPLFWSGFYALCALVPLLGVFKINSRVLYALCAVYGIAVIAPTVNGFYEYLRHSESMLYGMSPDRPYIEEAREFLGTLIAFALITVSMFGRGSAAAR